MHSTVRKLLRLAILSLPLLLWLSGCEQCSRDEQASTTATPPTAVTSPPGPAAASPAAPAQNGAAPEPVAEATPAPAATELKITDVKVGKGAKAESGRVISVHYVGKLPNGSVFDNSRERNSPYSFTLGTGMVIKGWDQGVEGMRVGGVRHLVVPPDLAYGSRSVGGIIPPNATLTFDIELLKVE